MVTAVLEARCGVVLAGSDVFLNVAGGLKVSEPAADLAVAAALLSSLTGKPVPSNSVVFGEIGLSAEIRAVSHAEARLKEAAKLGFERAILPEPRRSSGDKKAPRNGGSLTLATIKHLHDLVAMFQDETNIGRKAGEA